MDYEPGRNGDIRYIWLFATVALLVLGIAVINYVNLATARSSVRMKEIGVRKVIGSGRNQLMGMFLTESVVFSLLAAGIAMFLTFVTLPLPVRTGKRWQFRTGREDQLGFPIM